MQLGFESHTLKDNPKNLPPKPKRQRSTPISGFLGYVCALVKIFYSILAKMVPMILFLCWLNPIL